MFSCLSFFKQNHITTKSRQEQLIEKINQKINDVNFCLNGNKKKSLVAIHSSSLYYLMDIYMSSGYMDLDIIYRGKYVMNKSNKYIE